MVPFGAYNNAVSDCPLPINITDGGRRVLGARAPVPASVLRGNKYMILNSVSVHLMTQGNNKSTKLRRI